MTRQELRDMERAMKEEISSVRTDLLEKMSDSRTQLKELTTYIHESQHKQSDVLQNIALTVAILKERHKDDHEKSRDS